MGCRNRTIVDPFRCFVIESEIVSNRQIYSSDACYLKPIFVQMNDYMSLKILNRRTVTLRFLANTKNVRIELGTILNLTKEVGFYFVDMRVKFSLLK